MDHLTNIIHLAKIKLSQITCTYVHAHVTDSELFQGKTSPIVRVNLYANSSPANSRKNC